jgi:hypothetical protein
MYSDTKVMINIDKSKNFSTNLTLIVCADVKGCILACNRPLFSMQNAAFHVLKGGVLQSLPAAWLSIAANTLIIRRLHTSGISV